jgi:hypothetical protein
MQKTWARWVMTICLPVAAACSVDVIEPTATAEGPIHVQEHGVPEHSHVSTLLTYATDVVVAPTGEEEVRTRASAYLTNGAEPIDALAVTVNSKSLDRIFTGQYVHEETAEYREHEDFLTWLILAERPVSMTRSHTAPASLRARGIGYMDTITATHGMVIRYSGARGKGEIVATLTPAGKASSTMQAANDAEAASIGRDDGTVLFTREQLSTLRPNAPYDLCIQRGKYEESKVNGRWVGHYASTSYTVRVILRH